MYVVFFSTVAYLKSNQISISMNNNIFRLASFSINLMVLFYISGIFCFEFIEGIKKYLEMVNNSSVVVKNN